MCLSINWWKIQIKLQFTFSSEFDRLKLNWLLFKVFLITDGRPNEPLDIHSMSCEFERLVRLFVVAIGDECDFEIDLYRSLALKHFGSFHFIPLPDGSHRLKDVFHTLFHDQCEYLSNIPLNTQSTNQKSINSIQTNQIRYSMVH